MRVLSLVWLFALFAAGVATGAPVRPVSVPDDPWGEGDELPPSHYNPQEHNRSSVVEVETLDERAIHGGRIYWAVHVRNHHDARRIEVWGTARGQISCNGDYRWTDRPKALNLVRNGGEVTLLYAAQTRVQVFCYWRKDGRTMSAGSGGVPRGDVSAPLGRFVRPVAQRATLVASAGDAWPVADPPASCGTLATRVYRKCEADCPREKDPLACRGCPMSEARRRCLQDCSTRADRARKQCEETVGGP